MKQKTLDSLYNRMELPMDFLVKNTNELHKLLMSGINEDYVLSNKMGDDVKHNDD